MSQPDDVTRAMAEAEAELVEAQRRISAVWSELTHAQNALARAQQKWLEARACAKKSVEANANEPSQPDPQKQA